MSVDGVKKNDEIQKVDGVTWYQVDDKKGFTIFGIEYMKIPCMRTSYLTGYIGLFVGGAAAFLYTGSTSVTVNAAIVGFWIAAVGQWTVCRREFEKTWRTFYNLQKMRERRMELLKQSQEYIIPNFLKHDQESKNQDNKLADEKPKE